MADYDLVIRGGTIADGSGGGVAKLNLVATATPLVLALEQAYVDHAGGEIDVALPLRLRHGMRSPRAKPRARRAALLRMPSPRTGQGQRQGRRPFAGQEQDKTQRAPARRMGAVS